MKRMQASAPTLLLLILLAFFCCFRASLQFEIESTEMTVVVGETLALTCNLSEPIEKDELVSWKKRESLYWILPGVCMLRRW